MILQSCRIAELEVCKIAELEAGKSWGATFETCRMGDLQDGRLCRMLGHSHELYVFVPSKFQSPWGLTPKKDMGSV